MPKHAPLADPAGEYATPIPAAVKAAAAAADALHAQHYGKTPVEPATPANPDLVVLTPPSATPAATPAAPATPAAAAPAEPTPTPAATPVEPAPSEATVTDRAYKGMKGRFERASAENLQLKDHIRDLQAAVDTLQRAREAAPAAPVTSELTAKDLEEYGPDMVAMVQRVAALQNKQLQDKIDHLEGQLGQVATNTTKVTRASMLADLTKAVPNWQELDSNQSFLDWLALPDEYSGAIRHNLLTNAYQQNDAARVAKFFQGFLSEAARNPAPSPGVVPPAPVPPAQPQIGLETLAAPGRAKSTAPGTPPGPVEKPIISRADIVAFYAAKARGHYTPAQIQEYEAELFAAGREGRIRN